jgi:nucleoside-diphosphate-sugar epimerase
MDVFLTGASGYIGGVVAQHLIREGHPVRGLTRTPGVGRLPCRQRHRSGRRRARRRRPSRVGGRAGRRGHQHR